MRFERRSKAGDQGFRSALESHSYDNYRLGSCGKIATKVTRLGSEKHPRHFEYIHSGRTPDVIADIDESCCCTLGVLGEVGRIGNVRAGIHAHRSRHPGTRGPVILTSLIRRPIYHIIVCPIIMNKIFHITQYPAHFSNPMRTPSIIFVRNRYWRRLKAQIQGFRSAPKSCSYENYRSCSHKIRKKGYLLPNRVFPENS